MAHPFPRASTLARMAKLADALDLGSSGFTPVRVRLPLLAPTAGRATS
jgi:hypothetical protein